MVVVRKKDDKVRICIDPRDLNKAIKRCHYPMPTLEEVATRLPKAKVFSVLDVKLGFWQVKLSESSCKLMTFNTPFGRYYWRRMPFGINSAPEVWQRKADEFIEGLAGVKVIMDDFLVISTGRKNRFALSLQPGANVAIAAIASSLQVCKFGSNLKKKLANKFSSI